MNQILNNFIGIVGAGTMGCGIALSCAFAGKAVVVCDTNEAALLLARARMGEDATRVLRRQPQATDAVVDVMARITMTTDITALADCVVVVEAIYENLGAKQDLVRRLDTILAPEALIFSNTSALSVAAIASAAHRPERIVGTHFFMPAHTNALVEVVAAKTTNPDAVVMAQLFCRSLGKQVVSCEDTPGFVVNRIYLLLINEAARLVDAGVASAMTVDRIARETFGSRAGPLAICDQTNPETTLNTLLSLVALGPAYLPAHGLVERAATKELWLEDDVPMDVPDDVKRRVRERLQGAVLLPARQLVDAHVASANDIDVAVSTALQFRVTPSALAADLGAKEVARLIAGLREEDPADRAVPYAS